MSDRIPEPVNGLLRAVLEALDIPYPATVGDSERHGKILADRAMHAVIALQDVLADRPYRDIEWTTNYLRMKLTEHPPTGYRAAGAPRQDGGQP